MYLFEITSMKYLHNKLLVVTNETFGRNKSDGMLNAH